MRCGMRKEVICRGMREGVLGCVKGHFKWVQCVTVKGGGIWWGGDMERE